MGTESWEEEAAGACQNGDDSWGMSWISKKLARCSIVVQDLEEVEEWNEYGELNDQIGSTGGSAPVPPNTPSTPSKAAPSMDTPTRKPAPSESPLKATETPTKPPPSTSTESPLTTAMRQAGLEAAKKAGDNKLKALAIASGESRISKDTQRQLDGSAPSGLPPPSDTTEAESAVAQETGAASVESKADGVSATLDNVKKIKTEPAGSEAEPEDLSSPRQKQMDAQKFNSEEEEATSEEDKGAATNTRRPGLKTGDESDPSSPSPEDGKTVPAPRDAKAHGEKVTGLTNARTKVDATAKVRLEGHEDDTEEESDEAQDLPGQKTQEQPAGMGSKAGESVTD